MMWKIVGAGLSGLIAGNMLPFAGICERKANLPNAHKALLRFRSLAVSDATGIPFRAVQALKQVHNSRGIIPDSIGYSRKLHLPISTGRSIINISSPVNDRYIAPHDLAIRLAKRMTDMGGTIEFDTDFSSKSIFGAEGAGIISTIPLPDLLQMLKIQHSAEFRFQTGYVVTQSWVADLMDVYATMYYPHNDYPFYRASFTGNTLMIEGIGDPPKDDEASRYVREALITMGINCLQPSAPKVHYMPYAKIFPIPEDLRKRLIMHITDHYGIYSLGRFATWRPSLLLDDIPKDVNAIRKMSNDPEFRYSIKTKGQTHERLSY